MTEHSIRKARRNKPAEDSLEKQYGDIGIKAVAAAVKSKNKNIAEPIPTGTKPVSTKRNESNNE
ncbi:MAG: hypothetical protein WA728_25700 [Xanthobacteraceae bacterium]